MSNEIKSRTALVDASICPQDCDYECFYFSQNSNQNEYGVRLNWILYESMYCSNFEVDVPINLETK